MDDLVLHGTLALMLSTLLPGDRIKYEGTCYTVIGIKSWRDPVHGMVYALDIEARGKNRRISMVEGARVEGC